MTNLCPTGYVGQVALILVPIADVERVGVCVRSKPSADADAAMIMQTMATMHAPNIDNANLPSMKNDNEGDEVAERSPEPDDDAATTLASDGEVQSIEEAPAPRHAQRVSKTTCDVSATNMMKGRTRSGKGQ